MRKILFILCALMAMHWPDSSHAQSNPCNVTSPNTLRYISDFMALPDAQKTLKCVPKSASETWVRTNTAGVTAWAYCKDPSTGKWSVSIVAGTWDRVLSAKTNIDTSIWDPKLLPVWCPFQQEIWDNAPKDTVVGQWITSGTTAYSTTKASLQSVVGTVTKGVTCDCATPLKIGNTTYCTFAGAVSSSVKAACQQAK